MIWHQPRYDAKVLRQAFVSQRELLIESNGPLQEVYLWTVRFHYEYKVRQSESVEGDCVAGSL